MPNKLGPDGLLTYKEMIIAYNAAPGGMDEDEEHENGLEAVAGAQRDAMLAVLDGIPIDHIIYDLPYPEERCVENCPGCAVEAFRNEFKRRVGVTT